MPMSREWNGMTIQDKVDRASGRAIVAIGVSVATETKRVAHRVSGTLVRSVHLSIPGEFHDDDEDTAKGADMLLLSSQRAAPTPLGPVVEVGSWLPYACVEWVGRGHPGVTQGLEMVRGARSDQIVAQAFREEGL